MAGGAYGFSTGRLNLIQALLVKPDREGRSQVPLAREYMYAERSPLKITDVAAA